jgi:hypothetical protein
MHGRMLLHARLPGIAKEGQTLLLLMVGKTCVLSLISNQVINHLKIIRKTKSSSITIPCEVSLLYALVCERIEV